MEMTFHERLKTLKLTKTDFGNKLGLSPTTVSQWKDNPPKYALAYLKLLEEKTVERNNDNDILLALTLLGRIRETLNASPESSI